MCNPTRDLHMPEGINPSVSSCNYNISFIMEIVTLWPLFWSNFHLEGCGP